MSNIKGNIQTLHNEISWLQEVIHNVISSYLEHEGERPHWTEILAPNS